MTNKSEFYTSGWESVTNSTWLIYILKDWIGQDYHYPDYMGTFLGVTVTILFSPLLPWFIVCLFCNLCLHIYKRMNGLEDDFSSKLWDNGKLMMSHIIHMYGKLWHGYEVHGIEKIPEGPGLIVFYHGASAVDYHFFVCNFYIQTKRVCYSVVHNTLPSIPGIQMFLKLLPAVYGGREECVEILKKGNLLGVAPGGAQESFFSSESYNLLWGNRKGFAQVAIDAKVPIIPLFTQNIREGYRTLGNMWFIKWLNKRFQLSFVPGYGGFPVKLRTYIGDPIPYDPNIAATELVEKTKIAIERLRDTHQKLPGNILRALLERFDKHQKAA
ncbi:DGAT1/2-independent enzyme synthesizing storage lipids-like isoform X1 [Pelodiscus sinensis]|uniref:DGAT1/2-independent enzyme synthesizing storage lipids-like isoform X1 n=1 Tax=Pelodiscus sinensis TaxID=13735 RepID=UPI0003C44326|nr:transmembrane protein 68-like isoform X1 [Pelodiscus sinensis]XP_025042045.1 transmembrane protein 68-like isoform X1 [Pelodiscus sinensis]|eukprot:XP_006126383.1 transmembrane protein 68-like isoform X1 [Pelodiscus sinensis]